MISRSQWKAVAWVTGAAVGFGLAYRLPAILTIALIVGLAVVFYPLAPRGDSAMSWVVASTLWGACVGGAIKLITAGGHIMGDPQPFCSPSAAVECRTILNGRDVGRASIFEQQLSHFLSGALIAVVGIVLLILVLWFPISIMRDRRRKIRAAARRRDGRDRLHHGGRRPSTLEGCAEPDIDPELQTLMVAAAKNLGIYGRWIQLRRGREQFKQLQELDDAVYADALRSLVEWHPEWYRLIILTLKLGNDATLDTLLSALRTRNSRDLALAYINSEHPHLAEHGRRWLERHGYTLYHDQMKYGEPMLWGDF